MKKRADVTTEGDWLSLSKMLPDGVTIQDIVGHVSTEFGDPVFQLFKIVLSNGELIFVEGEHDMPYLSSSSQLDEVINAIHEEQYEH